MPASSRTAYHHPYDCWHLGRPLGQLWRRTEHRASKGEGCNTASVETLTALCEHSRVEQSGKMSPRRPNGPTGLLRDSLVRFGGWPLPTQRERETTVSDSPTESGGAYADTCGVKTCQWSS
jgi:hypothetical protein